MNEITRAGSIDFEYDGVPGASNGNLTNDGTLRYEWDAFNRLTKVYETPSSPVLIATYTYDALNRRIRKKVESGGLPNQSNLDGTTDFLYFGMRCVEERNPLGGGGSTDTPTKQFIWGIYLDECIQMKTLVSFTTGSGGSTTTYTAGVYYPLQDLLYRTIALTNSSGAIVETFDYDAYGNTLVFNAAGTGSNWWADDARQVPDSFLPFLFTGQRFNSETQVYYCKRREYSPKWGRFLSKDPLWDFEHGIAYGYANLNPVKWLDPYGLECDCGAFKTAVKDAASKIMECPAAKEIVDEVQKNVGRIMWKCCQDDVGEEGISTVMKVGKSPVVNITCEFKPDVESLIAKIFFEVLNAGKRNEFLEVSGKAGKGELSKEEFITGIEKIEYGNIERFNDTFNKCKWGPKATIFKGIPIRNFDDYLVFLGNSHAQALAAQWEHKYKKAYCKKHPKASDCVEEQTE